MPDSNSPPENQAIGTSLPTTATTVTSSATSPSTGPSEVNGGVPTSTTPNNACYTATTTVTVATTSQTPTRSTISPATLAGSVVGSIVAAAAITFLVTFVLLRSKRRTAPPKPEEFSGKTKVGGPRDPDSTIEETWEQQLLEQADDRTIRQLVKTVLDLAEVHIENHYTDRKSLDIDEQALRVVNSPHLPAPLQTLLRRSARPTLLMKHCLARILLGDSIVPLLPASMDRLPHLVGQSQDPSVTQVLGRWRRLTTYLHPPPGDDDDFKAVQKTAIDEATRQFAVAFAPWQRNTNDALWQANLDAVFQNATNMALLLFSQPAAFEFRWTPPQSGSVVVLPSLVRLSDENGVLLHSPLALIPQVVDRL
ncbi:uncharacterized protein BKCO1_37000146 [Diplodia corticola]|uniref:Uncharacterized protein n=1 Tax=Diplodia corticola TaxID=236234 RepID=A0A1J9RXX2_9PEZI|nr:uncharacterized protein BKCO1_37000146 [Diplodia corticola]OJD32668.1 hypothetical protein BKCO1_37000146 [Diplodia corticola]